MLLLFRLLNDGGFQFNAVKRRARHHLQRADNEAGALNVL